ncbi:MAG: dihydrolipoyl dehydrogenase [Candidatus Dormibacteria bacterium]
MTRCVVLGGGPAGDVAALHAAQRGADVVLVEERELGGTCLNRGCIPTKALLATADVFRKIDHAAAYGIEVARPKINIPAMLARKNDIVRTMRSGVEGACERKKVRVVEGHGIIDGTKVVVNDEQIDFDTLIVCVGTAPKGLPFVDMTHERILTSDDILDLDVIPKTLTIIGGGVIGCEFASLYATLGTKVTVIEAMPRILAGIDARIVSQFQTLMESQRVTFLTGTGVSAVSTEGNMTTTVLEDGTKVEGEYLLIAVGRGPLTRGIGLEEAGVELDERGWVVVDPLLVTGNPAIYAAGDCIGGVQLAHLASAEGARAVDNALGIEVRPMDRTVVPSCIYTHPEIAAVGLSEEVAKQQGLDVQVTQTRFRGNGKALAEGEPDGIASLVTEKGSGIILGATVMGVHAVEVIHEIGVAMSDGLTSEELGDIIHAHPTVSELIMDTAQHSVKLAPYLS